MSKHVRISLTIPENLNRKLDSISRNTGISRSALVSELLSDRVSEIHSIVAQNSQSGTAGTAKRMRGASTREIQRTLSNIMDYLGLGDDNGNSMH